MTYKAAIVSGLDEYLTVLRTTLEGLSPEDRRHQIGPSANHVDWLVWHMARVEDNWIARVSSSDPIWTSKDWFSKIGVGTGADDNGAGWAIEQVIEMPGVSMDELLDYFADVRKRTLEVVDGLSDADMQTEIQHPRMGALTNAWVLGHVIVEEAQHLGQIALIKGILGR